MAQRWLRGPQGEVSGGNYSQTARPVVIMLYFFLRYVMGYTFVDNRTPTSGLDFDGCQEDEGTDGIVTNTDFTFTAASASFSAGDVDKFICLLDNVNDVNCGIYKILSYVSPTQVTIDYYSTSYPVAATSLSWWLFDSTFVATLSDAAHVNNGEGVVLAAPHATTPFEIFIRLYYGGGDTRIGLEFASAANCWDATAHAWKSGNNEPVFSRVIAPHTSYFNVASCKLYAYGDSDLNSMFICLHMNGGTSGKTFASWGVLDPMFESSRNPEEKFWACGMNYGNSAANGERNGNFESGIGYGQVWSAERPASYLARWCGWRDSGNDFFKRTLIEPNHRDGTEYDGLPIWVQGDADVSSGSSQWAVWGAIPKDHIWLSACAGIGELKTFGSDQFMHWREGITTPWPGIPSMV